MSVVNLEEVMDDANLEEVMDDDYIAYYCVDPDELYCDYIVKTVDPSPYMFIVLTTILLGSLVMLPFFVIWGRQYEDRQKSRSAKNGDKDGVKIDFDEEDDDDKDNDDDDMEKNNKGKNHKLTQTKQERSKSIPQCPRPSSAIGTQPSANYRAQSAVGADDNRSGYAGNYRKHVYPQFRTKSVVSGARTTTRDDTRSEYSVGSLFSPTVASFATGILNTNQGAAPAAGGRRHRNGNWRHRVTKLHAYQKAIQTEEQYMTEERGGLTYNDTQSLLLGQAQGGGEDTGGNTNTRKRYLGGKTARSVISDTQLLTARKGTNQASRSSRKELFTKDNFLTRDNLFKKDNLRKRDAEHKKNENISILINGEYDIRPEDAVDHTESSTVKEEDQKIKEPPMNIFIGTNTLFSLKTLLAGIDKLLEVAHIDNETVRIMRLAVPWTLGGIIDSAADLVYLIIIAQKMSSDSLTAYLVNGLFLGLTDAFAGGVTSAVSTHITYAVGAENYYLAGQYLQIGSISYIVFSTPFLILWCFIIGDVMLLMHFNENTAKIAVDYTRIVIYSWLMDGVGDGFSCILEVTGHEKFETVVELLEKGVSLLTVFIYCSISSELKLTTLAIFDIIIGAFFWLLVIAISVYKGWFTPYAKGIFGSLAFRNFKAVKLIVSTAVPLSISYFLEYGEWELLTFFVAVLGPAEVTTWTLLDYIWELFEALSSGIQSAVSVRVSLHLGAGNGQLAAHSGNKALFLCTILSFFSTSVLFIVGNNIPALISKDKLVQSMMIDLIPMMGVGNIAMTFGFVSWTLVWCQMKYRISTFIGFISSWGITVPLSAVFCLVFNFNLQGVLASVMVGYGFSATTFSYLLIRSDWDECAKVISELNVAEADEEESSESESEE